MATSTGRDGGLPGSGGPGATAAHTQGKGLAGMGFVDTHPPAEGAPSKEEAARFGDVDKVAPNQPVTAAKQAMEEDRGQTFTSASGRPTEPSPTNM